MKQVKKWISLLLVLTMFIGLLPASALASELAALSNNEEPTIVFAASDFQHPDDKGTDRSHASATLSSIIDAMQKDGYNNIDGLLFAGDYEYDYYYTYNSGKIDATVKKNTEAGINAIKKVLSDQGWTPEQEVYIQGNHDAPYKGNTNASNLLAQLGNNDPASGAYGVFAINEDNYRGDIYSVKAITPAEQKSDTQALAKQLDAYLADKLANKFTKPIFVVSHVPLHFTARQMKQGEGRYAKLIFDVLNSYGAKGLNIIFLYGHNHSSGFDVYMGNGAQFLPKGDKIRIADPIDAGIMESSQEYTLSFTYMNAGFTGYMRGGKPATSTETNTGSQKVDGADYTLTSTIFEIYSDHVVINRYDADGEHVLKSEGKVAGRYWTYRDSNIGIKPNTTVYNSGQIMSLSSPIDYPIEVRTDVLAVEQRNSQLATWTATDSDVIYTPSNGNGRPEYTVSYNIKALRADGGVYGGGATVQIRLPKVMRYAAHDWLTVRSGGVPIEFGNGAAGDLENGILTVYVDSLAEITVTYEIKEDYWYQRVYTVDDIVDGQYLIMVHGHGNSTGGIVNYLMGFQGNDAIPNQYGSSAVTVTGRRLSHVSFYTDAGGKIALGSVRDIVPGAEFDAFAEAEQAYYSDPDHLNKGNDKYEMLFSITKDQNGKFHLKNTDGTQELKPNEKSDKNDPHAYTYPDKLYGLYRKGQYASISGAGSYADGWEIASHGIRYGNNTYDGFFKIVNGKVGNSYYSIRYDLTNNDDDDKATAAGVKDHFVYSWSYSINQVDKVGTAEEQYYQDGGYAHGARLVLYRQMKFEAPTVESTVLSSNEGTVSQGASSHAATGSKVTTTWSDGSVSVTPVTVGMLNGASTAQQGSFDGFVTYFDAKQNKDVTVPYTLHVTAPKDYPEFPEEGSVRVNKVADTTENSYFDTGVARIDLTATGVPMNVPLDVLIVLDTSSSMTQTRTDVGAEVSRIADLAIALNTLVTQLKTPNADGIVPDIDFAVTQFNTYTWDEVVDPNHTASQNYELVGWKGGNLSSGLTLKKEDRIPYYIGGQAYDWGNYEVTDKPSSAQYRSPEFQVWNEVCKKAELFINTYADKEKNYPKPPAHENYVDWTSMSSFDKNFDVLGEDHVQGKDEIGITTYSGTNYDDAFERAYDMLVAKQTANTEKGEERQQILVFMSDGAPYQFNYICGDSGLYNAYNRNPDGTKLTQEQIDLYQSFEGNAWNRYLTGSLTANDLEYYVNSSNGNTASHGLVHGKGGKTCDAAGCDDIFNKYYNDEGKHWMAEAIKGKPGEGSVNGKYKVIRTDSTAADKIEYVEGLGIPIYAIGLDLARDNTTDPKSAEHVLNQIASDGLFFNTTAGNLGQVFSNIGTQILKAGTGAVFTDKMSEYFELQLATTFTKGAGSALKTITLSTKPTITYTSFKLYQPHEVGTVVDGQKVTQAMVGTRKPGAGTQLEMVTFNENGTEASSNLLNGNILVNGQIKAKHFTFDIATQTFTWTIGDITQEEAQLSYYVYLKGSMEGERPAGSFPTNEYANLNYYNYLNNKCVKPTVSPVLPWKSANVSYGFYLVDDQGRPITNQDTGDYGSFANAVKLTDPVLYSTVLLNSSKDVNSQVVAKDVLPDGYELYDPDSGYTITIHSGVTESGWKIDGATDTTYVTGYNGTQFTNEKNVNGGGNSYTNTTVWFAVRLTIKTIPDAVVIDYGLPVDIHVLANDMFGTKGVLVGIGEGTEKADMVNTAICDEAKDAQIIGEQVAGNHGVLTVNGPEATVTYTPNKGDMKMTATETFIYCVEYTGEAAPGFYYGTVQVIPAANIYYEDQYNHHAGSSFLTFHDGVVAGNTEESKKSHGSWSTVGTTLTQKQSEDRPGFFTKEYDGLKIDYNNVYGYDPAYSECNLFSLGSAHKVTVSAANNSYTSKDDKAAWPKVEFTFTGTGFDVVSLTSNTTGTIFVDVYGVDNDFYGGYVVDTYYGCTYDPEKNTWVVNPESKDALYQVPVMKVEDLTYGTYRVEIIPTYSRILDHAPTDSDRYGQYDFYMDAVRIYDPAIKDETARNAYLADNEANPYLEEIRNLLLNAKDLDANDETAEAEGIVFVDGLGSSPIAQYEAGGPNNEVYLAGGQGIAFYLWAAEKPLDVQFGVKLALGNSAKLSVGTGTKQDYTGVERTVKTATNMFYSLGNQLEWYKDTDGTWKTTKPVVIFNQEPDGQVANVISLTDIKWTFEKDAVGSGPEAMPQVAMMSTFSLAEEAYETAREAMIFRPQQLEYSWLSDSIVVGQWAFLTVKTSSDVQSLTVNGRELTRSYTFRGVSTWTYSYKTETVGTEEFRILAYNAEGYASEAMFTKLQVREVPAAVSWLIGVLDKIFKR